MSAVFIACRARERIKSTSSLCGESRSRQKLPRSGSGAGVNLPRVLPVRSADTFHGDDWIGLKMRDVSVVRGIGVLPVFAGLIGLLLLIGSLAATWAREGR